MNTLFCHVLTTSVVKFHDEPFAHAIYLTCVTTMDVRKIPFVTVTRSPPLCSITSSIHFRLMMCLGHVYPWSLSHTCHILISKESLQHSGDNISCDKNGTLKFNMVAIDVSYLCMKLVIYSYNYYKDVVSSIDTRIMNHLEKSNHGTLWYSC